MDRFSAVPPRLERELRHLSARQLRALLLRARRLLRRRAAREAGQSSNGLTRRLRESRVPNSPNLLFKPMRQSMTKLKILEFALPGIGSCRQQVQLT